jgi:hypothetical protein
MNILGLTIERRSTKDARLAAELREKRALQQTAKRFSMIAAASNSTASRSDFGNRGTNNEDAQNQEYLDALDEVIQRAQNLDVNNPDLGGFHVIRTAQIVGAGVTWKHSPRPDEIDMETDAAAEVSVKINRLRQLHSDTGGFDSTGKGRSEGKQQERAVKTMLVTGGCLIHRVAKLNPATGIEFSLELIPRSRITTPYEKYGNTLVNHGVRYSDAHRTEVVGYYVRRVSTSIGNSFMPDFTWDLLPIEDCSLLEITEQAGLDAALPLSVRCVKQLRNQGEMIESIIEGARAHSRTFGVTTCAPGDNPFNRAQDDSDFINSQGVGFTDLGEGVRMLYNQAGEETTWKTAVLPGPDYKGFTEVSNGRLARGLNSSLSSFTREVSNSFSAGKMEEGQDQPILAQYRESFLCAWRKVNGWFTEAVWLADAVEMPGYSTATAIYWSQYAAVFFGKVQINPMQGMQAREKGMMLRTVTPQLAAAEDGRDHEENMRQWAAHIKLQGKIEKEFGIPAGSLDVLFAGRALTTQAGADITPETQQIDTEDPDSQPANGKPKPSMNGVHLRLNGVNHG